MRTAATVYPGRLLEAEKKLLAERRHAAGLEAGAVASEKTAGLPQDTVGFALSGGGIRSATQCLGLFQALSARRLLGRVDYLSTVSGGGYFGSFLGAWFSREAKPGGKPRLEEIQDGLDPATPLAPEVFRLRENGRYLAPNGAGDFWQMMGTVVGNLAGLHLLIGIYLLGTIFLVPGFVHQCFNQWVNALESVCRPESPFYCLALPLLDGSLKVLEVMTFGDRLSDGFECLHAWSLVACAAAIIVRWICAIWSKDGWRNAVSRWVSFTLKLVVVFTVILVVEKSAQWLRHHVGEWMQGKLVTATVLTTVSAFLLSAFQKLQDFTEKAQRLKVPQDVLMTLAAGVVAYGWLVCLCTLSLLIPPAYTPLVILVMVLACFIPSRLVNILSLRYFYGLRLMRAYLGASNPLRPEQLSKSHSEDTMLMKDYAPQAKGGPIHLINVTVNETVDGRSKVQQQDRKGTILSHGPAGLSLGLRHHGLWQADGRLESLEAEAGQAIHTVWKPVPGRALRPERGSLSDWISTSGAAFTPGMGSRTSLGLAFLLGFGNVRLGWWWDSGTSNRQRTLGEDAKLALKGPGAWAAVNELASRAWARLFGPAMLVHSEFTATFHGTARRDWYLSDGGHFENTAVYEMLRRRVRLVFVADNGADPTYNFEDFSNLVRKARIDFMAEISVLKREQLEVLFSKELAALFVDEELFSACVAGREGLGNRRFVAARVKYADSVAEGADALLILIKPTVTEGDPADILNYKRLHESFPQESTTDQFFDEAQWESYRRIGELAGNQLWGGLSKGASLWAIFNGYEAGKEGEVLARI